MGREAEDDARMAKQLRSETNIWPRHPFSIPTLDLGQSDPWVDELLSREGHANFFRKNGGESSRWGRLDDRPIESREKVR